MTRVIYTEINVRIQSIVECIIVTIEIFQYRETSERQTHWGQDSCSHGHLGV